MTDPDDAGDAAVTDAVEQARAWLVEHAGVGAADAQPGGTGTGRPDAGTGRPRRSSGPAPESDDSFAPSGPTDQDGPTDHDEQFDHDDLVIARGPADHDDPDADHENVARTIALRKLTARACTRHELGQALQKKNVPGEVAAVVLDRLEEVGLVDDEVFAQDWVASRQQRRHLSRAALRRELQGKGVDRDHVDDALATVDTDDELAAARALAAKKSATMRSLEPLVRRRRLAGVLARRGFGSGIVSTVLGEIDNGTVDDPGA